MKKVVCLFITVFVIILLAGCQQTNSFDGTSSAEIYLTDDELAETVAKKLWVPDDADVTWAVSEKFYWEAGNCYYKNVEFYENGILSASASVDPTNGELLRNILQYCDYSCLIGEAALVAEINFYTFFEDKNLARAVADAMDKTPHQAVTEDELANYSGGIYVGADTESLAGIGYLKSITELEVAKNRVTEIPSEISQCKSLKRLDLLKAYSLEKLPENIGELENLEFLRVSLSEVNEMPESIGNLKKLKYLYFDNCPITTVPESIGDCESLIILDLHSTDIAKIPDSVTNLKNLKSLDLGYTKITALPENIGELTELLRLDLFGLDIKQLPQSTKDLKKLEYLNVYNNYNLNEDYKQWFANECYKCITDPENDPDWDDGR